LFLAAIGTSCAASPDRPVGLTPST